MTATITTTTAQAALISHEAHGRNMRIVAVGTEAAMLALHAETPYGGGTFYSVRPVDHELTQRAAKAEAERLGARQAQALRALAASTQPGQWIKPGNRKMNSTDAARWGRAGGQYSADAAAPLRKLAEYGLVRIHGVDFAPKSYKATAKGRLVAAAI